MPSSLGCFQLVAVEPCDGFNNGLPFKSRERGHAGTGGSRGFEDFAQGHGGFALLHAEVLESGGHIAQLDQGAGGKGAGAFQGVFKLTDVAGPVVLVEDAQSFVAEFKLLAVLLADAIQEVGAEQGHILTPLPERRQAEAYHVEPVEEVFCGSGPVQPSA